METWEWKKGRAKKRTELGQDWTGHIEFCSDGRKEVGRRERSEGQEIIDLSGAEGCPTLQGEFCPLIFCSVGTWQPYRDKGSQKLCGKEEGLNVTH